jgi:ferredoxin
MLVDLYRKVSPELTLMDGIVAMEGNGPQTGDPRELRLISASADAAALDAVICEIVGLKRERMPTTLAAEEMGAGHTKLEEISVAGDDMGEFMVGNFAFPPAGDMMGMFPNFMRRHIRTLLTTRPILDTRKCKMCLICLQNCPAKVITEHGESLRFDLDKCIRCFCCQEMCPEGAITVGSGPLARVLRL